MDSQGDSIWPSTGSSQFGGSMCCSEGFSTISLDTVITVVVYWLKIVKYANLVQIQFLETSDFDNSFKNAGKCLKRVFQKRLNFQNVMDKSQKQFSQLFQKHFLYVLQTSIVYWVCLIQFNMVALWHAHRTCCYEKTYCAWFLSCCRTNFRT